MTRRQKHPAPDVVPARSQAVRCPLALRWRPSHAALVVSLSLSLSAMPARAQSLLVGDGGDGGGSGLPAYGVGGGGGIGGGGGGGGQGYSGAAGGGLTRGGHGVFGVGATGGSSGGLGGIDTSGGAGGLGGGGGGNPADFGGPGTGGGGGLGAGGGPANGGAGSAGGDGGPIFDVSGNASMGTAGSGASAIPSGTFTAPAVYEYIGIGGGGGGGGGGASGQAGGNGTDGSLIVNGASVTAFRSMLVGGGGGGGGGGSLARGGNGGSGTLTLSGGAALMVAETLLVGGMGGGHSIGDGGVGGDGTVTVESSTVTIGYGGRLVLGAGTHGGSGVINLGNGDLNFGGGASFTININGTLNLGNATPGDAIGGTISGLAALANQGQINFNQSNTTYVLSTAIFGGGSVAVNGSGTTILTGANTYTGGTGLNAGTLQIGDGGITGEIDGDIVIANGAALVFNRNNAAFYGGNISGEGSFTQRGAGTLLLTGSNSATGNVTVERGTVVLSGPAARLGSATSVLSVGMTGTGSVMVQGGSTLVSHDARIGDGTAGAVTVEGTGSTWTGNNIFVAHGAAGDGDLTVADGGTVRALQIGMGSSGGSGAVTVTGSDPSGRGTLAIGAVVRLGGTATIDFDGGAVQAQTDQTDFFQGFGAGDISIGAGGLYFDTNSHMVGVTAALDGSGGLIKTGTGTLTLNGANSYTGGTRIVGGVLSVSSDAHLGDKAGGLTFDGGGLAAMNSFDTGRAVTFIGDGSFDVADGLELGLTGVLSGTGRFTKAGQGTLVYDGNGSSFGGVTDIAAGALIVGSDEDHADAAIGGSVNVGNGAILGGHGTVGSGAGSMVTVASGGTVAAGYSIGTLTIDGNYVQKAGSIYEAEINPDGSSDLVKVTGTATIEGGTMFAIKTPGSYAPGTRYTILSAAGGVNGTYDALEQNAPFVDLGLAYGANDVFVDITRNDVAFPTVGNTRNQKATAAGLESLGQDSDLYSAIVGVPDEDRARAAFDALSGEIHASAKSALIEGSHFVRDAVNDRIRSAFGNAPRTDMSLLGYGPDGVQPATADSVGPVAWGQTFGSWGSFDGDSNAAGMDSTTGGIAAGIDGEVTENFRLGLIAGYSHSSFEVDGRASTGSSDNYHLGLYGGGRWDALRLSGGLAYTWNDIETNRSVAFPGFADGLGSDYGAGTFQAFGEAGYRIDTGAVSFEPFANLAYVSLHTDGFAEFGGAAALSVSGGTTDATFTTLGLHVSSAFDLYGMTARAHGTLGWRHAFGDTTPISTHAFADPFMVAGMPIAEDAAVIEVGLDLDLTRAASIGLAYQGQLGETATQNGLNAKLSVKF